MKDPLRPRREDIGELIRPWKVATFVGGVGILICGSLFYKFSDWDIGISILMGSLTYVCAPWSVNVIHDAVRRRPKKWMWRVLGAVSVAYGVVDGSYWFYHWRMGNEMFRYENFMVSLPLYFLLGIVWSYRGSICELFANIKMIGKETGKGGRRLEKVDRNHFHGE